MRGFLHSGWLLLTGTIGCDPGELPETPVTAGIPPHLLVPATLEEGGLVTCADPSRRATEPLVATPGSPLQGEPVYRAHGAGAVVGDFNGDDQMDILVLSDEVAEFYVAGVGGELLRMHDGWTDSTAPIGRGFGTSAADYDGDGDLDIYIARYGRENVFLQNDGAGFFTDVAPELGMTGPAEGRHSSVTWADIDNDGDLDLTVAGHGFVDERLGDASMFGPGERTLLYRNEGDGTFTEVGDLIPEPIHYAFSFTATYLDLDGDGWRDLYMANDFGSAHSPAYLAWNRQGTFVLDDNAAALDVHISAMGTGVGDFNGDGQWDFLLPAWGYMNFMLSTESGVWFDYADAVGLVPAAEGNQKVGWGAELADVDNDADLDAVVVFGYIQTRTGNNSLGQPNGIWLQGDDGLMTQVSREWGFDHRGSARGLVVADLNDDGYLDMVVPDLAGPSMLYYATCGDRSWLKIRLDQPGMNPDAIGARVKITTDGGVQERMLFAGGTSLASGGPPELHFGLGDHEVVETLQVSWPDGKISVLEDVAASQTVEIHRAP
ncbi:MAG TPA: CRTAC1 family protein [Deltaproteobacteria bacterium]|nr:CRTAC1 family protein [Deltaproteobacteria bacterium]